MRAILTVTVDPELVVQIEKVRKQRDLNTSKTVEFLVRLGLDSFESGHSASKDSK
jgi:hypothetical protein